MRVESSARLMGRGAGNMPKTCKKGKFLLKIRVFIATFNHSGLLPPLNMLVSFFKKSVGTQTSRKQRFSHGNVWGVRKDRGHEHAPKRPAYIWT